MARKYGKKNVIKIDPLSYNLGIIGESGIGKSTIVKEICETLVGEDGYMFLTLGKEDGHDAIADINYEEVPDWAVFEEIIDDIIENKTTDYKDLRVIVYDTLDELFAIAEEEVIKRHNRKNPTKKTDTIKAAFGGYQAGEDMVIKIIQDSIWQLKRVGISMFIIGHTKVKSLSDPITGQDYEMLTTNMNKKYFTALQTKLHVLGVASINREITKVNAGKDFTGKDKMKGVINSESRIITFRDDNFNIDSKSRFAEIKNAINFDKNEFIEAVEEAIRLEHNKQKNKKDIEVLAKEQEEEKDKKAQENLTKIKKEKEDEQYKLVFDELFERFTNLKSTPTKLKPFLKEFKNMGYEKIDQLNDVTFEQAKTLLEYLE